MPALRRKPIVAIDGPAGSGKSTVAKLAARAAGLQFVSSGAYYRAVALLAVRGGVAATDEAALTALADGVNLRFTTDDDGAVRAWLNGDEVTDALREPAVEQMASTIAVIPPVRAHLVRKLREYGCDGGLVMEGRDIQTVVFPDAEVKVYLTASVEERARRRWEELRARGETVSYAAVLDEVNARDARDTARDAAPLRAAPDAVHISTDGRSIAQVVAAVLALLPA
ncbi:MAG TPA: (d)CMP kinase [Armatimonadota bacterium]|nr:(d)CMP kinase [Armatimonadota bacterium]HOS43698.1 (d)CMP kinase [Armatimonadota bacterium]